jgi:hypothetical protein
MRNLILLSIAILTINLTHAQFALDNMESYGGGNTVILGGPWTSWDGSTNTAMFSSSAQAQSGSLSGYVDGSTSMDPILKLGNKIFGSWGVKFSVYIPTGKIGYWNMQGTEAPGIQWVVGNIFMGNSGIGGDDEMTGRIDLSTGDQTDDFVFQFPKDQWFDIVMNFDFNAGPSFSTWAMWVNNVNAVPAGTPYADGSFPPVYAQGLGGINFYSIAVTNEMYLDDVEYIDAFYPDPTIVDTEDPVANCQNITVQLDTNGTVVIDGISIDGGSTDNVGVISYTATPNTLNCNNIGANNVTLTVADAAGNTDTCMAIVTVEDTINPIVLGQDTTGNINGTGSVTIPISNVNNGSSDNCGIDNFTLTPDTFTTTGTFNAVLEGTDASGNSDDATVIITIIDVLDTEDPIAICQDITVQLDANGMATINGNSIDGGSTDDVGIVSYTATPNTFDCSNLGANAITLVVADALGNTDNCIAMVTVEDSIDPTVIGQDVTADLLGTGSVTIPVSDVNNGSFDNCNIDNFTLTPDIFNSPGTYAAVLEATDASGNADSVSVTITIVDSIDNQAPTAICQNITIQLNNSGVATIIGLDIDGGSTDNVGIVSFIATPDFFNCNNLGTNSVSLIVEDAAGNTDICTAIVTVEDVNNPTIIGQDATGDLNGTGSVTIPVSSVNNGSNDNCNIANLTLTPDTFTSVGTYNADLEGTDTSGNTNSVTVSITIDDSLGIIEEEITSFSMYPNPANKTITIDGGENTLLKRLEIFDITGKQIVTEKIEQPTQKFNLDISSLESSIYFVSVTDVNGRKVMRKLIKE